MIAVGIETEMPFDGKTEIVNYPEYFNFLAVVNSPENSKN